MEILYYLLAGAAGAILMAITLKAGSRIYLGFKNKTKLIKYYWLFVIIFTLLLTISYIVVITVAKKEDLDFITNVINHVSGLIFAIFTGYFAFSQLMESRYEKFISEAFSDVRDKRYQQALKKFDEARGIRSKDAGLLATILELKLMLGQYKDVENEMVYFKRISLEDEADYILNIQITKELLREHISEAKEYIKEMVSFIDKKNPNWVFKWSYIELQESDVYKNLKGDAAKIFKNYINYMTNSLSPDERVKFTNGDYTL
jgi:uncharacterized protein (UPF0332 family)